MSGLLGWVGEALFGDESEAADAGAGAASPPPQEAEIYPDNMISKEHLYEIFSGFAAAVQSAEGKERLAKAVKDGQSVEDVTQRMQEEIAEKAGLDGKDACSHFKYVLKFYKEDTVLCEEFVKFCELESNACDEAEMGPEKFKEVQDKMKMEDAAQQRYRTEYAALTPQMRENMAKQLTMLTKSPAEMDAMLNKTEASMRNLMKTKPMVRTMIVTQLKQQFAAVGASDEFDEDADVITTMITKVREGTVFMREQIAKEATERGVSFDDIVQSKLDALREAGSAEAAAASARGDSAGAAAAPAGVSQGKLRFKVGDLVSAKIGEVGDNWQPGRIAAIGYREAHFPPGFVAPYQVELHGGRMIYAPYDNDTIIRAREGGADEPFISAQAGKEVGQPAQLRFKVGDKVAARVKPTEWADAVIVSTNFRHPEMPPGMTVPYQIRVEKSGDVLIAPHDVPEIVCERGKEPNISGAGFSAGADGGGFGERRFSIGQRVEARVSMVPEKWVPATVESTNYREPHFPPGAFAPYRLRLDDGQLIFAPHDTDAVVRHFGGGGGSSGVIERAPGL